MSMTWLSISARLSLLQNLSAWTRPVRPASQNLDEVAGPRRLGCYSALYMRVQNALDDEASNFSEALDDGARVEGTRDTAWQRAAL